MAAMEATVTFGEKYYNEIPAGFRFRPKDKELVVHYLKKKALNQPMPIHRIRTYNIYTSHPRELCSKSFFFFFNLTEFNDIFRYDTIKNLCESFLRGTTCVLYIGPNALIREKERYFFTTRDKKYRNGSRPDRKAGEGFWRATGKDFPVRHKGKVEGFKRTLVYYEGIPSKGIKTDWIMHEYRLNPDTLPSTSTTTYANDPNDDNDNNIVS